uniref:Uncharacterized protein n=1 Tax=Arion vulgaris TaxID=1028688 RepID=A0A0B6ZQU6_9EUPU
MYVCVCAYDAHENIITAGQFGQFTESQPGQCVCVVISYIWLTPVNINIRYVITVHFYVWNNLSVKSVVMLCLSHLSISPVCLYIMSLTPFCLCIVFLTPVCLT